MQGYAQRTNRTTPDFSDAEIDRMLTSTHKSQAYAREYHNYTLATPVIDTVRYEAQCCLLRICVIGGNIMHVSSSMLRDARQDEFDEELLKLTIKRISNLQRLIQNYYKWRSLLEAFDTRLNTNLCSILDNDHEHAEIKLELMRDVLSWLQEMHWEHDLDDDNITSTPPEPIRLTLTPTEAHAKLKAQAIAHLQDCPERKSWREVIFLIK